MTLTGLKTTQGRITKDLAAWRRRHGELISQRDEQRARAEAGRAGVVTALSELAPDERALGKARKDAAAAVDAADALDAALLVAAARVTELAAAEDRAGRQLCALTAKEEIGTLLAGYAALDRAWQPVLQQIQELIEHEEDLAALLHPLLGVPGLGNSFRQSKRELAQVLTWRLGEQLDHALGRVEAACRVPAATFQANRLRPIMERLDALCTE